MTMMLAEITSAGVRKEAELKQETRSCPYWFGSCCSGPIADCGFPHRIIGVSSDFGPRQSPRRNGRMSICAAELVRRESLSELRKLEAWFHAKHGTTIVLLGGWAVYSYNPYLGSFDIDCLGPGRALHMSTSGG